MKVLCVGGGPAGLYTGILARLSDPSTEVEVLERSAPADTHGWGVVFGENLLDDLHRHDPEGGRRLREAATVWARQEVRVGVAEPVHLGGRYGFSMGRTRLLELLAARAEEVGVRIRWGVDADPASVRDEADVVVAADGAGSRMRAAGGFDTRITPGRNRYAWLGTDHTFDAFTFAFERTDAGWIWFHGYPSSGGTSTCIVECTPEVWTGLGLDGGEGRDSSDFLDILGRIFARHLGGRPLRTPPGTTTWQSFRHVRTASWVDGNVALAGDAAHTTHFAIGSGTTLAIQDAIRFNEARALFHDDPAGALAAYDAVRSLEVDRIQVDAARSMAWFEELPDRVEGADPVRFGYELLDRRGDHSESWRYQVHLATQVPSLRRVRQGMTRVRREARAARRR
ncbi:FAD-dependent monooxygenase [Pseudonocardia sp. WMMC193]|uniref:FAD-dependent monooxygenase n=1 Tax=Pseudonocardia sp. WMMC193 TaxID=2911965 RepID=UPI001F000D70|nr:FAD-dependent monooxygenase [Pseudonocardia sp. WMMC193]MCF7548461.1 FAD-dependent monooxygenase [Pseudonocardia sp. WMMC193]